MNKFSIIVPVYKVEKYINKCIDSVLSQTYKNFELILVDDQSPDLCPVICDQYALKDSRIKVIHQNNRGLGGARNAGVKIATGDYIVFLDSDDWIDKNFCNTVNGVIEEKNSDIVLLGETLYIENEKRFSRGWRDFSLPKEDEYININNFIDFFTPAWGRVYKKSFLNNYKLSFIEHCCYEDNSWGCFIIMLNPRISFAGNLYYYRQRLDSITGIKDKKVLDFAKDYNFFVSKLPLVNQKDKNIELCNYWYLLNFYNYYYQLSEDLQKQFFTLIRPIFLSWKYKKEFFNKFNKNKKLSNKLSVFYNSVIANDRNKLHIEEYTKKYVKLFNIIPLICIKSNKKNTIYYLFGFVPCLKIKVL